MEERKHLGLSRVEAAQLVWETPWVGGCELKSSSFQKSSDH